MTTFGIIFFILITLGIFALILKLNYENDGWLGPIVFSLFASVILSFFTIKRQESPAVLTVG